MIRVLLLSLCVCGALSAQTSLPAFIAFREAALSGAGETVTIQQPASPSKTVQFEAAAVFCSAACEVTLERDGSAATSTTFIAVPVATDGGTASASAFHTSDSTSGTVLSKYSIGAGNTMSIDLRGMRLPKIEGKNISWRIASMTGTVRIYTKWTEQ